MRKIIVLLMCMLLVLASFVSCKKATSPERVLNDLAPDTVAEQFGFSTWQTTLTGHTVADVHSAFVQAGYQALSARVVDGTNNPPLVLAVRDVQVILYPVEEGVRVMWDITARTAQSLLMPNQATGTGEVTMVQFGHLPVRIPILLSFIMIHTRGDSWLGAEPVVLRRKPK